MSIEHLNLALKLEGLTPTKKLILVILANYADEKGSCYPSYNHIGLRAGVKDVKHIRTIIKEFESLGFLKILARYKEDGGNTSNRYFLTIPKGVQTPIGVETPDPLGAETHTPPVSTPPNTKEDTKEDTKELFEEFWKHYPRKTNKYAASVKYKVSLKDLPHDKLVQKCKAYGQFVKDEKMDTQFVPHCTTWLNQKRYLDESVTEPKMKNSLNNLAG